MSKVKVTSLPTDSDPKPANEKVVLSEAAKKCYGLATSEAKLVERGEVESVIEVEDERYIVGNEEVSEA